MTRLTLAPALIGLSCSIASLAQAQVQTLGAPAQIPAGAVGGFATKTISDDGRVVGGTASSSTGSSLSCWTEAEGFTVLPVPALAREVSFGGMSASGELLVGTSTNSSSSVLRAIRWNTANGQVLDLGVLPGDTDAAAAGVSGDGSTVIGDSFGPAGNSLVRWTAQGGIESLGPLSGYLSLGGISFDGAVIVGGGQLAPGTPYRAFVWRETTGLTVVPGLGQSDAAALGVSRDGAVVMGFTDNPAFPSSLFYFGATGTVPVDVGPGTVTPGSVLLSGDGSTVTGDIRLPNGEATVFVWTQSGGGVLLDSADGPYVSAISHDGAAITGGLHAFQTGIPGRAYRWTRSGGIVPLSDFSAPTDESWGRAMTPDGSVVVGTGRRSVGATEGVLWRSDGSIGRSYCPASVPNSTGQLGELTLSGSNTIAVGSLELRASGLPAGTFGFFLVSAAEDFVGSVPNSQGSLCLGGPIGRLVGPGQVQQASGQGAMSLYVDPAGLPLPTITPAYGQSLYFQAWYRDSNPTATSNFTSAATVRFY